MIHAQTIHAQRLFCIKLKTLHHLVVLPCLDKLQMSHPHAQIQVWLKERRAARDSGRFESAPRYACVKHVPTI